MPAELEIRFSGDSSFVNALSQNVQPVPTMKPVQTNDGKREAISPLDVVTKLLTQLANDSGDTTANLMQQIAWYQQQLQTYQGLPNYLRPGAQQTPNVSSAIPSTPAPANAGATNDYFDKFGTVSPQIASKDMLFLRREFTTMRRGEELTSEMGKGNSDKGKLEEAQTKAVTELYKLAFDAWELTKPLWEIVHDVLKEFTAWMAWFRAAWATATGKERADLEEDALRAREKADLAWNTNDLGGADNLDIQANELSQRLLNKFGVGSDSTKRQRIPPMRDR